MNQPLATSPAHEHVTHGVDLAVPPPAKRGLLGGMLGGRSAGGPKPRRAAVAASRAPSPRSHGGGMSGATRLVVLSIGVLLALGAVAVASGALQLGTPDDIGIGSGGGSKPGGVTSDTWSYYHDRTYDTTNTGPKWSTDRTRSTDPDEAVLGDTSRWEYDGAYQYGPYGSDGLRRRASGRESVDPLYSQQAPTQDVFSQYGGDLDPSGGQPVGAPPSNLTNPYYDPYGGYSNPYANRIRMSYGEGYGSGAASALAP